MSNSFENKYKNLESSLELELSIEVGSVEIGANMSFLKEENKSSKI